MLETAVKAFILNSKRGKIKEDYQTKKPKMYWAEVKLKLAKLASRTIRKHIPRSKSEKLAKPVLKLKLSLDWRYLVAFRDY